MENINLALKGYSFKKIIGKYEYGELLLTYESRNLFLTKRIERQKIDNNGKNYMYIKAEINILSKISHKNIIKLKEIMKTKRHYYIVIEYCNGGTLRENLEKYKIKFGKSFSAKIVQHIIKQLIDIANYIYDNHIVIFDLSLDNIYLNYYTEEAKNNLDIFHSDIKLTNFRKISVFHHRIHNFLHSFHFHITFHEIDFNNELKSLGKLCYNLLTGDLSINNENIQIPEFLFYKLEYDDEIKTNEYKIPINISFEAVSFLIYMIQYFFYKGVKAVKLLNHPFIQKDFLNFTDFNKNIVSKFIKDKYLIVNFNNIDEISSIINKNICL